MSIQAADLVASLRGIDAGFASTMLLAENRVTGLHRSTGGALGGVKALELGLAGLAAGALVASARAASEWSTRMTELQNNTTLTATQMVGLSNSLLDMATRTSAPLSQLADGMMHVQNLGFSGADAMKVLNEAMMSAVGTGANTSKVAEVLALQMHEFNIQASGAAGAMNVLHLAAALGNATLESFVESTSKATATAANLGVPIAQVDAALSALSRHMPLAQASTALAGALQKIVNPSKSASDELLRLTRLTGIDLVSDFTAAGLKTRGLSGIMDDLRRATGGNATELMKLIPATRGGLAAMILTGSGAKDFTDILGRLTAAQHQASIAAAAFKLAQNTAAVQMGELGNQVNVLAIRVGNALLPTLVDLAKQANALLQPVEAWVSHNGKLTAGILAATAGVAAFALAIGPIAALVGAVVSPIGLVAFGMGALYVEWTKNKAMRAELEPVLKAVGEAAHRLIDDFGKGGLAGVMADLPHIIKPVGDALGHIFATVDWGKLAGGLAINIENGIQNAAGAVNSWMDSSLVPWLHHNLDPHIQSWYDAKHGIKWQGLADDMVAGIQNAAVSVNNWMDSTLIPELHKTLDPKIQSWYDSKHGIKWGGLASDLATGIGNAFKQAWQDSLNDWHDEILGPTQHTFKGVAQIVTTVATPAIVGASAAAGRAGGQAFVMSYNNIITPGMAAMAPVAATQADKIGIEFTRHLDATVVAGLQAAYTRWAAAAEAHAHRDDILYDKAGTDAGNAYVHGLVTAVAGGATAVVGAIAVITKYGLPGDLTPAQKKHQAELGYLAQEAQTRAQNFAHDIANLSTLDNLKHQGHLITLQFQAQEAADRVKYFGDAKGLAAALAADQSKYDRDEIAAAQNVKTAELAAVNAVKQAKLDALVAVASQRAADATVAISQIKAYYQTATQEDLTFNQQLHGEQVQRAAAGSQSLANIDAQNRAIRETLTLNSEINGEAVTRAHSAADHTIAQLAELQQTKINHQAVLTQIAEEKRERLAQHTEYMSYLTQQAAATLAAQQEAQRELHPITQAAIPLPTPLSQAGTSTGGNLRTFFDPNTPTSLAANAAASAKLVNQSLQTIGAGATQQMVPLNAALTNTLQLLKGQDTVAPDIQKSLNDATDAASLRNAVETARLSILDQEKQAQSDNNQALLAMLQGEDHALSIRQQAESVLISQVASAQKLADAAAKQLITEQNKLTTLQQQEDAADQALATAQQNLVTAQESLTTAQQTLVTAQQTLADTQFRVGQSNAQLALRIPYEKQHLALTDQIAAAQQGHNGALAKSLTLQDQQLTATYNAQSGHLQLVQQLATDTQQQMLNQQQLAQATNGVSTAQTKLADTQTKLADTQTKLNDAQGKDTGLEKMVSDQQKVVVAATKAATDTTKVWQDAIAKRSKADLDAFNTAMGNEGKIQKLVAKGYQDQLDQIATLTQKYAGLNAVKGGAAPGSTGTGGAATGGSSGITLPKNWVVGPWAQAAAAGAGVDPTLVEDAIIKATNLDAAGMHLHGKQIAMMIAAGLARGLTEDTSVAEALSQMNAMMGGKLEGYWQIHSPSRRTYQHGLNIAQGLADGIRAGSSTVASALAGMTTGGATGASGASGPVNVVVNVHGESVSVSGNHDAMGKAIGTLVKQFVQAAKTTPPGAARLLPGSVQPLAGGAR